MQRRLIDVLVDLIKQVRIIVLTKAEWKKMIGDEKIQDKTSLLVVD